MWNVFGVGAKKIDDVYVRPQIDHHFELTDKGLESGQLILIQQLRTDHFNGHRLHRLSISHRQTNSFCFDHSAKRPWAQFITFVIQNNNNNWKISQFIILTTDKLVYKFDLT